MWRWRKDTEERRLTGGAAHPRGRSPECIGFYRSASHRIIDRAGRGSGRRIAIRTVERSRDETLGMDGYGDSNGWDGYGKGLGAMS